MARISHVTEYNSIMNGLGKLVMVFTTGNGSLVDKERVRGWVVYESPSLGDGQDFAKFYMNKKEAINEWKVRS